MQALAGDGNLQDFDHRFSNRSVSVPNDSIAALQGPAL
jgi:hypothetical protein